VSPSNHPHHYFPFLTLTSSAAVVSRSQATRRHGSSVREHHQSAALLQSSRTPQVRSFSTTALLRRIRPLRAQRSVTSSSCAAPDRRCSPRQARRARRWCRHSSPRHYARALSPRKLPHCVWYRRHRSSPRRCLPPRHRDALHSGRKCCHPMASRCSVT
jgi:hypothetical protein